MFDLDQAITEWRRQMAAGGIVASSALDELESHLREDVQRQLRSGMDEQRAFEVAVQRMGQSELLKAEFAKVNESKEVRAGKIVGICCGLAALPLSAMAVPNFLTLPELTTGQRLLGSLAVALTFLSLASWRFSHRFLRVIRQRRVRMAITISCGLAGLAWLFIFGNLLSTVIVPRLFADSNFAQAEQFRPVFTMGIFILWAMALTAVLGGIAYGLEEAARRSGRQITA